MRSLKARRGFFGHLAPILVIGVSAMNLFVLEAFFRIFAVRGHIPGYDGRPDRPPRSSLNQNSAPLILTVAIVGAALAILLLAVWAAVSIAIK